MANPDIEMDPPELVLKDEYLKKVAKVIQEDEAILKIYYNTQNDLKKEEMDKILSLMHVGAKITGQRGNKLKNILKRQKNEILQKLNKSMDVKSFSNCKFTNRTSNHPSY